MARFSGYSKNATSAHSVDADTSRPRTAWIGLATSVPVEGAMTADEALTKAGLDWSVSVEPITRIKRNGESALVPDQHLVVRDDTEHVFATCGKIFVPTQNHAAFDFADSLREDGIPFDAAGSWDHGAKTFLSAKLPSFSLDGQEGEEFENYLLMTNAHDLTGSLTISITPTRIRCANMLNLAFKGATNRWSLRHTSTTESRLELVRQATQGLDQYVATFKAEAEALIQTALSLDEFDAFLAEMDLAPRISAGVRETYLTSNLLTPGNAWGAINAVSEFTEHLRGGRGTTESRFQSNLFGQAETIRNRATRLLVRR